ncbi:MULTISPECIES: hypothetical protein [Okeania]|nr:hypothetical protein [Okeania sp. SIO2B9]
MSSILTLLIIRNILFSRLVEQGRAFWEKGTKNDLFGDITSG